MRLFALPLALALGLALGLSSLGGAATKKPCRKAKRTCAATTTARAAAAKTRTAARTTTPPRTTTVASPPSSGTYPLHTGIAATTFWVGEIYDGTIADGSQACSTYDARWASHWSGGANLGTAPGGTDCAGAPIGGCDGRPSGSGAAFTCATEKRTAANGYFPTSASVRPAENPF